MSTNPATLFGFGTWVAFGAGRVIVGVGTSDATYAAGATGGESTHVLTTPEMPSHTHGVLGGIGSGTHTYPSGKVYPTNSDDWSTGSAGSGSAHNNLQPYIVAYMWNRTA